MTFPNKKSVALIAVVPLIAGSVVAQHQGQPKENSPRHRRRRLKAGRTLWHSTPRPGVFQPSLCKPCATTMRWGRIQQLGQTAFGEWN